MRKCQRKVLFWSKISSKPTLVEKLSSLFLLFIKFVLLQDLSVWESIQKKVKILSWPCKSFRFTNNCLQLFTNLWRFENTNIFAWNSVGNNKFFLDFRLLEKLAFALMRKTYWLPLFLASDMHYLLDISDRIINSSSTGNFFEGALPPL